MKFRWTMAPPQPLLAGELAAKAGIPLLLAQCLLNRGFSEPAAIGAFLGLKRTMMTVLLGSLLGSLMISARGRLTPHPPS